MRVGGETRAVGGGRRERVGEGERRQHPTAAFVHDARAPRDRWNGPVSGANDSHAVDIGVGEGALVTSLGQRHALKKRGSNLDKPRQNLWKPLCGHVYRLDTS